MYVQKVVTYVVKEDTGLLNRGLEDSRLPSGNPVQPGFCVVPSSADLSFLPLLKFWKYHPIQEAATSEVRHDAAHVQHPPRYTLPE